MTPSTERTSNAGGGIPPRPVVVTAWAIHRGLYRLLGRRRALRPATEKTWGMMRLKTVGRKSGKQRAAILGYYEDGPNLVTMAMNGWGEAEPAWWLNLQAHPEAIAQTRDGVRRVRAHRARGAERERLWARWAEVDKNLDAYAARRPEETAVVVLEPQDAVGAADV